MGISLATRRIVPAVVVAQDTLLIPDSRFEMPELFYPGRKPVGNVKIDWGHPLSRGLSGYSIFTDGGVVNLVNYHLPEGYAGNALTSQHNLVGDGVSGFYFNQPRKNIVGTIMAIASANQTSNTERIISFGGNSDNLGALLSLMFLSTGDFRYQVRTSNGSVAASIDGGSYTAGESVTLFGVTESRSKHILYMGDMEVNSSTVQVPETNDLVFFSILGAYRGAGGWAQNLTGVCKLSASWDRVLSPLEVSSMNANPYQFLIPA